MSQNDHDDLNRTHSQHPGQQPLEPDHPMELNGCSVPGNPALMLRIQLEELMMTGTPLSQLRVMMNDPQYQSLYAAGQAIGKAKADATFNSLAAAVGSLRCTMTETQNQSNAVDLTVTATQHHTPNTME